jgi:hypothetical protein
MSMKTLAQCVGAVMAAASATPALLSGLPARDRQGGQPGRRRSWVVGSLVPLLALAATLVQPASADAATHVGISEPRVISTEASPSGSRATLGVRVRSATNVKQVRIYLFTTSASMEKRTVIGHLSKGTNNDGSWTGTTTFSDVEAGSWRIGKVRVLGSQYRLLRSKTIPKNTAAVLVVYHREVALIANGRTRGPESARTTKFALRMRSDNVAYPDQNVPVRLSAEFRRPSGTTFLRRIETRTDENGKAVVTFGPYHMARVRSLTIELPDPGGGTFSIFFDLR